MTTPPARHMLVWGILLTAVGWALLQFASDASWSEPSGLVLLAGWTTIVAGGILGLIGFYRLAAGVDLLVSRSGEREHSAQQARHDRADDGA